MRLFIITILVAITTIASFAQDTLKNQFKDQPSQIESWYITSTYKDQAIYNGDFMEYYSNGEIKQSGGYSMGQLHGNSSIYTEDGTISVSCRYTNGILNGEHKTYYSSGNLKERKLYINGKLQGDYKFYKDEKNVEPYLIEKYSMGTKKQ